MRKLSAAAARPEDSLSFRTPLEVSARSRTATGDTYPVCPRCRSTLEREYQAYCDRCGQCLGWQSFPRAPVITGPIR